MNEQYMETVANTASDMPVVIVLFLLAMFILPTLIAVVRNHKNLAGVLIVNVCLGLTFFGWVGALVWATIHSQAGTTDKIT